MTNDFKQEILTAIKNNDVSYLHCLFTKCENKHAILFALDKITDIISKYNHIKNILK